MTTTQNEVTPEQRLQRLEMTRQIIAHAIRDDVVGMAAYLGITEADVEELLGIGRENQLSAFDALIAKYTPTKESK